MNKYESPIHFEIKKIISDFEITYSQLREITQGGPEVGVISINGKPILGNLFGGPFLFKDGFIIAPVFVRKFLGFGFKLSKINTRDFNVETIGKVRDLIFIEKIEGNRVYFFEDLEKILSFYQDF